MTTPRRLRRPQPVSGRNGRHPAGWMLFDGKEFTPQPLKVAAGPAR